MSEYKRYMVKWNPGRFCSCAICVRTRRVKAIMEKLDEHDRKIVSDILGNLCDAEEELDMIRLANKTIKAS